MTGDARGGALVPVCPTRQAQACPDSDPRLGLEYLGEVTVAPITTTIRDIPSEVFVPRGEGVPRDCVVNCDHLQTVSKGKLGALITTLSPSKMDEVAAAIEFALALR